MFVVLALAMEDLAMVLLADPRAPRHLRLVVLHLAGILQELLGVE